MASKIWYIAIDEVQEGPFSAEELFFDQRVDFETLIWKEGFEEWVPLQEVEELAALFAEREERLASEDEERQKEALEGLDDEIVLEYGKNPNPLWWLAVFMLLVFLFLYLFG